MMSKQEFYEEIKENIREYLPPEYEDAEISLTTQVKNMDVEMTGLLIRLPGESAAPVIYLDSMYEQYKDGRPMEGILMEVADTRRGASLASLSIDPDTVTRYSEVRDKLQIRLLDTRANRKRLDNLVHHSYGDLTACYCVVLKETPENSMGCMVTPSMMKCWGITKRQLHEDAIEAVFSQFGVKMLRQGNNNLYNTTAEDLVKQYGSLGKAFRENVKSLEVKQIDGKNLDNYFAREYKGAAEIDSKLRISSFLKYATIALALVSAGLTVAALLSNDEADLPPVPKYMVDSKEGKDGKRHTVNYIAAGSNGLTAFKESKKNKGQFADTKAYEGAQWLTVYQTKDNNAGKPITPDFVIQAGTVYQVSVTMSADNAVVILKTEQIN